MGVEPASEGEGVRRLPIDPQRQRLESLEQKKGVERALTGAEVAQTLDPGTDDERDVAVRTLRAECFGEDESVVAGGRLGECWKPAARPVKVARVDDDAADGRAVTADPLGGRLDDDVGAVLDGATQITAAA